MATIPSKPRNLQPKTTSARSASNLSITPGGQPLVQTDLLEYLAYQDILEHRRLWLSTEVQPRSDTNGYSIPFLAVADIVQFIIRFNQEDKDKGIPPEERKPIKLLINTPGGYLYEGFSLIDTILASKTPVYTYNMGICMSMGFLIYIAGAKRFTLKNATFLHHEGTRGNIESTSKFLDSAEFNKRHERDVVKKHVLERTKITSKLYNDKKRIEWYMLPNDAIRYGVAHVIIKSLDEVL